MAAAGATLQHGEHSPRPAQTHLQDEVQSPGQPHQRRLHLPHRGRHQDRRGEYINIYTIYTLQTYYLHNIYTEYLLTIYCLQAWDPVMLKHSCLCGDETLHPESPGRLERILAAVAGGQWHIFGGRMSNIWRHNALVMLQRRVC